MTLGAVGGVDSTADRASRMGLSRAPTRRKGKMPTFIVAENPAVAHRVREVLTFVGIDCPSSCVLPLEGAVGRLARESAIDFLVIVLTSELERGLAMLPIFARIAPGKILAVGPSQDSRIVIRALRNGASDFVDSGDLETELDAAIGRRIQAGLVPIEPGKLIAVLSPNGGSGSSTVSASLAVALAKGHKAVALFDMKLQSGDLATLLDLRPTFSLADICRNFAKLDKDMFERSLVKHESGVSLLAAPLHIDDQASVKSEGVDQALHLAKIGYPFVVADVDHTYGGEQRSVLRQADLIVLVFRLEFASLRNVRRSLEVLRGMEIDPGKVLLVVNRYGQSQEVPPSKAEEALERKIAHYIPEDPKSVNRASNNGVPVVIESPTAKVSKSLTQLAHLVVGSFKH